MYRLKISNEVFDYQRVIDNIKTEIPTNFGIKGTFKKRLHGVFKNFFVFMPCYYLSDLDKEYYNELCERAYYLAQKKIVKILIKQKVESYKLEWATASELGDIADKENGRTLYHKCRCVAVYLNTETISRINLPEKLYGFTLLKISFENH